MAVQKEDDQATVKALADVQQLLGYVAAGNIVQLPRDAEGNLTPHSAIMAEILQEVADEGLHTLYSM